MSQVRTQWHSRSAHSDAPLPQDGYLIASLAEVSEVLEGTMAWLADARRLSDDDQNRLEEYFDLAREVLVAAAERKRKLLESAANLNLHHLVQLPPESNQTLGTGS